MAQVQQRPSPYQAVFANEQEVYMRWVAAYQHVALRLHGTITHSNRMAEIRMLHACLPRPQQTC